MDASQVITQASTKLKETLDHFLESLKTIRTGRANSSILDGLMVEAYGVMMPLKQVANVSAVEAQLLQITPFDPSNIEKISEAIRNNPSLGLNPSDDGRVVRLPIPPLTEERRREMAKQISEKVEDGLVRARTIRHEAISSIDELKKSKSIGEDEAKRLQKQIEELVVGNRKSIEEKAKEKESEILTI